MPRFLAALYGSAALALASAPVALACATPSEQAMFDVAGLKSELMVTALTCDADQQYDAFVTRYQALLQADDSELQTYFVHAYGRGGQAMHDSYITNVANKMSEVGIAEGTNFCQRHLAVFAEALALSNPGQLALFAASRGYVEPVAPASCTVLAADPPRLASQR